MINNDITALDILIETHVELDRLGPGSSEMTVKALGFIDDLEKIKRVADMGCGSGAQTLDLAAHISGSIIGVDIFPAFIDAFNENIKKHDLIPRVTGIVGSMDDLSFADEEFDLIWSEGAIDNIGFEKGLNYWNRFLKKDGYIAVTSPSWFTAERPVEVEKFWSDAGSKLDSVEHNILTLQKAGYSFVAAFALPERCWTDNYFTPRTAKETEIMKEYPGNQIVEQALKNSRYERELYSKYQQHYGYVFYLGKKL